MVETWLLAEKTYDLPWDPTSRSYNLAVRIIEGGAKGEIPKDRSSQKDYFSSLAKDYGVTRHTLNNIMYTLRSTQRIPPSPLGRINESSREDPSSQRKDSATNFVPSGGPPERTERTASETAVLSEGPEKGLGGSILSSEKGSGGSALSSEDVSEIKAIMKNIPEMIKQGAKEYVQGIGGPAPSQEDVETQANLKIEEGSAVARMVYLTPKTLLYYDFSRGRGFKGSLSEFLNNFIDSWFKRQEIKVGVIEKTEWG